MSKKTENVGFVCANCGKEVARATNGSYRNHCPYCLCSVHADVFPGDRASDCGGLMRAEGVVYNTQKGWQIVHKCVKCGAKRVNLVCDSGDSPDDSEKILEIVKNSNNRVLAK